MMRNLTESANSFFSIYLLFIFVLLGLSGKFLQVNDFCLVFSTSISKVFLRFLKHLTFW